MQALTPLLWSRLRVSPGLSQPVCAVGMRGADTQQLGKQEGADLLSSLHPRADLVGHRELGPPGPVKEQLRKYSEWNGGHPREPTPCWSQDVDNDVNQHCLG